MQKQSNIYTNKIKKIYFLKNEIKKILLKSVIQDNYVLNIYKSFALKKQTFFKKKNSISLQKNVCLILNKHRSVYSKFNLARHSLKKLNNFAKIPNIKSSSW